MAYKPALKVLIGRRNGYFSQLERAALEEELAHLEILTFDDILDRVRRRMSLLA